MFWQRLKQFCRRHWRKFAWGVGILTALCVVAIWCIYRWMLCQRVTPEDIASFRASTFIYDGHGELYSIERGNEYRWCFPISLKDVPPTLIEDVITVEDRHFRVHHGVDYNAMIRATWQMVKSRRVISGGSTISMQVVNQYCGRGRGVRYKLQQIGRAWNWEKEHTKEEILEEYFNLLPYGGLIYGIEAAARFYFGRPAKELNRAEQLLLVGLPQSPNRFRPDRHPEKAIWRRDVVLVILQRAGRITAEEAEEIKQQPLRYRDFSVPPWPHVEERQFLDYAEQQNPGHKEYHLTLFPEVQQLVQIQLENACQKSSGVKDGAAVVIETATGKVRAMVGTLPNGDLATAAVNAALAWRSPGSTLKPFIYGEAIQGGLITADTVLQDTPLGLADYRPTNFDGTYRGDVTADIALADSLNIPAIRLLARLGLIRMLERLTPLDLFVKSRVASPDVREKTAAYTGLSLAIGGLESRLLSLTSAYSSLGSYRPARFLEDAPEVPKTQYWHPATTALLLRMMRTRPLPGAGGLKIAWKTGTSNGNRDAWCFAVTPEWTVGVWFGNKSGTPNEKLVGGIMAAPVAGAIMYALHQGKTILWNDEEGLEMRPLCSISGLAPSPFCKGTHLGTVVEGIPLQRCAICQKEATESTPKPHAKILVPAPGTYLARRDGTIAFSLSIEPAEAHVYLDGEYLGFLKSGERMTLERGPHRLLVWPGEGWENVTATIDVR